MGEKILFVDDDPNILAAYQRQLRKQYALDTAEGGEAGLAALAEKGPYAVIIADMRMPGMNGVEFLAHARDRSPPSVRVMLTGNADQQTAIDAVNEGNIFRFLNKPCPTERLVQVLDASLAQHRLIVAEKELLENTLRGGIKVVTEVLSLVNPTAFGRAARIQRTVKQLAGAMQCRDIWQMEVAAMLALVGCVTVPETVLKKSARVGNLSPTEARMIENYPQVGATLIAAIPRLEPVARMIAYQAKGYDGSGSPVDEVQGDAIPLGARLLRIALDLDLFETTTFSRQRAFEQLRQQRSSYDPAIFEALEGIVRSEAQVQMRELFAVELKEHMVIAENVVTTSGALLISKGHEVSAAAVQRLRNFARNGTLREPLKAFVP